MEDRHQDDDDSCSVASSTSWWMLEDDSHRKITPGTIVIKLTQQLYDILIDISTQPKYLGPGVYWKSTHKRTSQRMNQENTTSKKYSWDKVIGMRGQGATFVLPLCYLWFGHIRLAMIERGVDNEESLYLDLVSKIKQLRTFQTKYCSLNVTMQRIMNQSATSSYMPQPLYFIVFTHVSNGDFQVFIRDSLRSRSTGISKIIPHQFEHSDQTDLSSHLMEFRILSQYPYNEYTSTTKNNSNSMLVRFKSSSLVSEELETNIPTGNNDDHLIEENWKKGFTLELEKFFALVHEELVSTEDTVLDEARLNEVIFIQNPDTKRWILNPFIVDDIESSLQKLLKEKGEELIA